MAHHKLLVTNSGSSYEIETKVTHKPCHCVTEICSQCIGWTTRCLANTNNGVTEFMNGWLSTSAQNAVDFKEKAIITSKSVYIPR